MPSKSSEQDKAKRVESLRQNIEDLRDQVDDDLDADDTETKFTALAVKMIDETYARVGNRESVKERSHYGISQLECRHFDFTNGKAKIEYTGKKGVDQEKEIDDDRAVSILKDRCDDVNKNECIFCFEKDGRQRRISPDQINDYLDDFDITSKDIRGFHANDEMKNALEEIRDDNGSLPDDEDEREDQLDEEFNEALDRVSDLLGHEASTLKSSYLVPHFEDEFKDSGSPPDTFHKEGYFDKQAMSKRVAFRCISSDYYDLGRHDYPLERISCLWAMENKKARDEHIHGHFQIRELWPYREYAWTRSEARPGYAFVDDDRKHFENGSKKWDAMKRDLKKNGWREDEQPVVMSLGKDGNALISEGNHRLAVAREIGMENVPVRFRFTQSEPDGSPLCEEMSAPSVDELTNMLI